MKKERKLLNRAKAKFAKVINTAYIIIKLFELWF